jgi:hypothetical protein
VDATCTEEPRKSNHTSPRTGDAEGGGAMAIAAPNDPMVRIMVAHSHDFDDLLIPVEVSRNLFPAAPERSSGGSELGSSSAAAARRPC